VFYQAHYRFENLVAKVEIFMELKVNFYLFFYIYVCLKKSVFL